MGCCINPSNLAAYDQLVICEMIQSFLVLLKLHFLFSDRKNTL
jgi:hypothetical protein